MSVLRLIRVCKFLSHELTIGEFINLLKLYLFRADTVFVFVIDSGNSLPKNDKAEDGREVVKGELRQLRTLSGQLMPTPWEFRCHEYDGVKDFFFVEYGGEIQHISWVYHQNDPNRILKLGPKDIEIKYCLTLPRYRGQGLYPKALKAIAKYYFSRGYQRVFISINAGNFSSIRGAEKAGFRKIGKTCERKALGIQLSRKISF